MIRMNSMSFLKHPYPLIVIVILLCVLGYWWQTSTTTEVSELPMNLVLNGSLEEPQHEGKAPRFWRFSSYGENDTISRYPYPGVNDSAAVYIEMLNHESGDAKWFFNDVIVREQEEYTYTTHYRSSVITKVFVRYNRGSCLATDQNCEFNELATLAPRDSWTEETMSFTVPRDVQSITVFQVIDRDGWLVVDEVSLRPTDPAVLSDTTVHVIPNAELNDVALTNDAPEGWLASGYGENERAYDYLTEEGYEDDTSVKVTVSNYESGDAKWMYEPQPIMAGEDYLFSVAYKTDVVPHVVVQFTDGAGNVSYLGLPKPDPIQNEWQLYQHEFAAPEGMIMASAFMFIAEDGYLQTDRYAIEPYRYQGFERPIVTLTFDDGAHANVETALPIMEEYGFKSTQCYMTEPLTQEQPVRDIKSFYEAGHEICAHSISHADLTTVSQGQLTAELKDAKDTLEKITGATVTHFASPYGAYDPTVIAELKKYYTSHRTVDEGYNSPDNFDRYRLMVQNLKPDTPLPRFRDWVDKAIADKTWLILVYHRVDDSNLSAYDTHTDDFQKQMEYLKERGVTVLTWSEALEEVSGQVQVEK